MGTVNPMTMSRHFARVLVVGILVMSRVIG
jgi:hypothetical protein